MRRIFFALIFLHLSLSPFPSAQAHSTLISSLPKAGVVLKALPPVVTLTFNEKLLVISAENPNSIVVTSPSGRSIGKGTITVRGNKASVSLIAKKISGKCKVAYRVVSADGHPISGTYFFTVK